jgi:hypothetical protein
MVGLLIGGEGVWRVVVEATKYGGGEKEVVKGFT